MAVIVIHAGMGKAGSSSVQAWLRANLPALREGGFTLLAPAPVDFGEVGFAPYERGPVTSRSVLESLLADAAEARQRADAFAEALAASAERHGDVIVSAEVFERLFYRPHAPALAALQRLSARHRVRVAYYVRPQHTALEAAWRQAGFRSGMRPSAHIERRAACLHYASTRRQVHSLAPDVEFEPRPFLKALLEGGDVVADFAGRFLGIETGEGTWANRGLPLEVVNVLRAAPDGMFWGPPHGKTRLRRIQRLLNDRPFPDDGRIALSRQVLRKYAHERFAAENRELGWDDFVPPPDDPAEVPGLEALDRLWEPQASPAELAVIFRALEGAVEE